MNPIRNHKSMVQANEILFEKPEAMLAINAVKTLLHYLDIKLSQTSGVLNLSLQRVHRDVHIRHAEILRQHWMLFGDGPIHCPGYAAIGDVALRRATKKEPHKTPIERNMVPGVRGPVIKRPPEISIFLHRAN